MKKGHREMPLLQSNRLSPDLEGAGDHTTVAGRLRCRTRTTLPVYPLHILDDLRRSTVTKCVGADVCRSRAQVTPFLRAA